MTVLHKLLKLMWLSILLPQPVAAQPTWQWGHKLQDIVREQYSITHIFTTVTGNIVVVGDYDGLLSLPGLPIMPWGYHTAFVARLDSSGNWTHLQALPLGASYLFQLAANGDLLVVGTYSESTFTLGTTTLVNPNPPIGTGGMGAPPRQLFPASFIARYSVTGTWSQIVSFNGPGQIQISAFVADAITGEAVAAGNFKGQVQAGNLFFASGAGRSDEFIIRFNAFSGAFSQVALVTGAGVFHPHSLIVRPAGEVIVGGEVSFDSVSFGSHVLLGDRRGYSDLCIARLSPNGGWTQAIQAGGLQHDYVKGLAVSPSGEIIVTGDYQYGITFGSVVIPPNPASRSFGSGSFVARLSPMGQWTYATAITSTDLVRLADNNGLATDGSLLVAGSCWGDSLTLGSTTLSNASAGASGFVARITPAGNWTWATGFSGLADIKTTCFSAGKLVVAGRMGQNFSGAGPVQLQLGSTTLTTASSAEYVALLSGFPTATAVPTPAQAFTLTPNPAASQVRLGWPAAGALPRLVQLFDVIGREVRHVALPAHITTVALDVSGLAPGIYVVRCAGTAARLVVE